MKLTNAQLLSENAELQKEIVELKKRLEPKPATNKEITTEEHLARLVEYKNAQIKELLEKEVNTPEKKIVTILDSLEIPAQVAILKQITSKKVNQFCQTLEKHEQASKFFRNNIAELKEVLVGAASEDIVNYPQ